MAMSTPRHFLESSSTTHDRDRAMCDDCCNASRGSPDGNSASHRDVHRQYDILDRDVIGGNASIPYASIESSGPPSRPLEFPAPTVDRAVTAAADILDHRTGDIFLATNVLMRRPIHSKNCASRALPIASSGNSWDSRTSKKGHFRTKSPDSVHSWHTASSSVASGTTDQRQRQQQRVGSLLQKVQKLPPCDHSCYLPDRAYCIRKKICNTTYGSIRLCVVLKRVSQNVMKFARSSRIKDAEQRVPTWETTDEMVAIKVVNWAKLQSLRGRHLEDPIKEVAALQQLIGKSHPNIISLSETLQNETHLFCVYPYVSGGDLCGSLVDNMHSSPSGRIDETMARTWFRQILSALNHLQKRGVCHRDLCLDNIMVDEENNIRIIDFGLCLRVPFADPSIRNVSTDVSANTTRRLIKAQGQCGKLEYMAPEVSSRSEAFDGFAIDLWAAGIILFELLVGKRPFTMADPVENNFHMISVEGNLAWLLETKGIDVSREAMDLLQGMLWSDPSKRLTLSEIIHHPWVEGNGHMFDWPVEEDGLDRKWFIKTKSIDDLDEAKCCSSFFTEMLNSYSTTIIDGDDSTSVSSAATSLQSSLPQAQSDDPSNETSSNRLPQETQVDGEVDALNKMNIQKKQSWMPLFLKNRKQWRA